MAHAQKPDLVFRRNGRVHLNRRGASVQSTTGSRGVPISGSNAGYTMFRGGVKGTDYPLHSPVSPLLSLPCVNVCHHVSTGLYPKRNSEVSIERQTACSNVCEPLIRKLAPPLINVLLSHRQDILCFFFKSLGDSSPLCSMYTSRE
jgi:hypothetical protein